MPVSSPVSVLALGDRALAEKLNAFRAKQVESVAAAKLPELS
jgi:phosphoribosylcarboxyaminoimidazole (NCAIR) mutase